MLPGLLGDLLQLAGLHREVIVVDGGSTDDTVAVARAHSATVVDAPRGRGAQLRAGIATSRAPLLCTLHADVRLPPAALAALTRAAHSPQQAPFAFRLAIDAPGFAFRVVEAGANLRSRWLRLPYGDQGLVISRSLYDRAGGYPDVPLMEDVALALALKPLTPIRLLDQHVLVSARRWQRDGIVRRTARNLSLLARYLAGATPAELAAAYEAPVERAAPNGP